MPQMSPILWTQLLIIITMNMFLMNTLTFFSTKMMTKKKNKKNKMKSWKW